MNILVDLRKLSLHPSGIGIYTYEFIIAAMDICKNISSDFYNNSSQAGMVGMKRYSADSGRKRQQ